MAKQSAGSKQRGVVDTMPKNKAPSRKRTASAMSSNEPHVRATSETIEAPTGSRAPSSRKVKRPGGDRKEAAATAVKRQTQYKTICGIDFGTTHSDVAIVGSVHCGISHIEVLRNWKNGLYLEQVPSRIAYPEENPGLDKITFGYEVTSTMKSYTWMKLLLGKVEMDDFTETKLGTKAAQGMLELPPGKTAEDVVCDYLKCLYEHIMDHLAGESRGQMLEEKAH